jgi:Tfp pilus assembly pilus retraction ATPase PilT
MVTMDKSLKLLYQRGLISYDDAVSKSRYPEAFDHI